MPKDSIFSKIRAVLRNPEVPEHIRLQRQYDAAMPWHRRLMQMIRPPDAVPTEAAPMSGKQRRTLAIVLCAAVIGGIGWWIYDRFATAPQRAKVVYEAGMERLGPNDYEGAIQLLTQSIAIRETGAAYLQRANAYNTIREFDRALADWSKAIELDPKLADAYTARGRYYMSVSKELDALHDFDKSIELQPTVDGYFQRGQLHAARGEFKEAIRDFDEAISQRREAPYVYLARSMARKALGDEEGYKQDQATAESLQHLP